jgi:hypothetical protein
MSDVLIIVKSKDKNVDIQKSSEGTFIKFDGLPKLDLLNKNKNVKKEDNEIVSTMADLKISGTQTDGTCYDESTQTNSDWTEDSFEEKYKRKGMYPLKEMKQHPEWKDEYMSKLRIKKVHICKSCRKKWMKGCCENYSQSNRVMLKMVIGWHE